MGEVRAIVKLENDGDRILQEAGYLEAEAVRKLEIDALVDTGAVKTLLPQDMVEHLGLKIIGTAIVQLANDEKTEMRVAGRLFINVCGRKMTTDCLVGPPRCEPLLGQVVMENLDLIIDPLKRTLSPRPESPFLPLVKLK